jgi:hypothetical protein
LLDNSEVLYDVYACRKKVAQAYRNIFKMTYDNWLQLGNLTVDHENKPTLDQRYFHCHYHFIPRYKEPIFRLNKVFADVQFGKPLNIDPSSGHKKTSLSSKEIAELREEIQIEPVRSKLINIKNLKDLKPTEKVLNAIQKAEFSQNKNVSKLILVCLLAISIGIVLSKGLKSS